MLVPMTIDSGPTAATSATLITLVTPSEARLPVMSLKAVAPAPVVRYTLVPSEATRILQSVGFSDIDPTSLPAGYFATWVSAPPKAPDALRSHRPPGLNSPTHNTFGLAEPPCMPP